MYLIGDSYSYLINPRLRFLIERRIKIPYTKAMRSAIFADNDKEICRLR